MDPSITTTSRMPSSHKPLKLISLIMVYSMPNLTLDFFESLHQNLRDKPTEEDGLQVSYDSCVYHQTEIRQWIECHYKGYTMQCHATYTYRNIKTRQHLQEGIKTLFNAQTQASVLECDLSELEFELWSLLIKA